MENQNLIFIRKFNMKIPLDLCQNEYFIYKSIDENHKQTVFQI